MSDKELRDSLAGLRAEVGRLGAGDEVAKARIQRLIGQLERKLQNPDAEALTKGFTDSVAESIQQYEVEHPRITAILSQILQTLANMGI